MAHHILVVDDETPTLDLIRLMLKMLDCTTDTAMTGAEAIALAKSHPPDAILLDALLPDMTGFEVCTALKQDAVTAAIPVIMLTAMTDDMARDRAEAAGVDRLLTKPFTRAKLQECLGELLQTT